MCIDVRVKQPKRFVLTIIKKLEQHSVIDNVILDSKIPNGITASPEKCKEICSQHPDCTAFAISHPHYFDPVDFIWKVGKPDQPTVDNILKQKHTKALKDPFDRDTTMHDKKKGGSVSHAEDVEHIVSHPRCWFHQTHGGIIRNKFFDLYTAGRGELAKCDKEGAPCGINGKCHSGLEWVPDEKKLKPGNVYFAE